jgi:NADPH:quinone reductase
MRQNRHRICPAIWTGAEPGERKDAPKMMSHSMLAMEISQPGSPDVLKPVSMPVPVPGHGQIVIRLAWAGVNRPDVLQRLGSYAPPVSASPLPGLEGAGTVVACGPGVVRWREGDQVCALLPGGGYAEYAVCTEGHALPIPGGLGLREAACLPETCFTVWSNVVMRGGLKGGETFLVHGGTSGIGVTAIQIARALGARVFATAGNDDKARACEALGAERGINYRSEDFVPILKAAGGADLILDMVGGSYIPRNLKALADDGRLVQIAFLQGAKVEIGLSELMTRRLTMTGSTLRPQSDLAKTRIAAEVERHVWPLLESGAMKVVIDSEFTLADAPAAHWRIDAPGHVGKIVLKVEGTV